MPKVLWVALPLLLAVAVLAVQVLRGRAPSRQAVNIGASVLLLGYLAATAGLGLFWVANQQLPVFDWHYLFGYGTVLLVLLHLAFNLPVVWRFVLRRKRAASEAKWSDARRPERGARRVVAGAIGAGAAAAAAYALGLRQGRREGAIGGAIQGTIEAPAGAAAPDPAVPPLAFVERFHAFSSHSRAGVLTRAPAIDWGAPPAPFKPHAGGPATSLPRPGKARTGPFDLGSLGDVLWHTAGVTETRGGLRLRASPSSGALFSTELYVAVRALPGLADGLWHYDPQAHALQPLGRAPTGALRPGAEADGVLRQAQALVIATSMFRRTGHKYRDRTYRYVLVDLGHALENLRVAAAALALDTRFVAAFDESQVAQALGVDEAEEGVLALVGLGPRSAAARPGAPSVPKAAEPTREAAAARWRSAPVASSASARGPPLGVTAAVHAATSLREAPAEPPASQALAAASTRGASPSTFIALPPTAPVTPDWLRVIARRRSVRRYAGTPLPLQALADLLWRMTRLQGPVLSAAVRINVVVHAVAGLAPGRYRHEPRRHALLPLGAASSLRAIARAAALGQDVIGNAAVVFVLSVDRATFVADPLGPARGYRHALLEAGLVGERVYLEAEARGLGACAVGGFYDDEAAALAGVDSAREWVVHFAALGVKEPV